MKTFWKSIACRVWTIVTPIVLAIVIVVNVLASVTYFDAIATKFGRSTTKIVGEEVTRYTLDDGIKTKEEALAYGNAVSKEICEEGFVLLKNEGALPLAKGTRISVFGKNSVNLAVGGSGSGGGATANYDLYDSLEKAGFTYNETLKAFYEDDSKSGGGRDAWKGDMDNNTEVTTLDVGEPPISSYPSDVLSSCKTTDAALIVFTRIGGEGGDLPRSDESHYLQISSDEQALIDKVTSMNFSSVTVILNTVTTMELKGVQDNGGIDAVLWIGYTGGEGILALGEVLSGEVNPSGRTVDTWAADFTHNPVWENFGALGGDNYLMSVGRGTSEETVYFADYEEGIYVGYRYYETRYAAYDGAITDIGESAELATADDWYASEVVYPFGYGKSYTTFEWTLESVTGTEGFFAGSEELTFTVKVTNNGDYAGKDVVQLYYTAPYYENGIEKSAKVLIGFAKTDEIQPGLSDEVTLTVESPYWLASYDCYDMNNNGFKGYETEAGTYTFTIGADAHNAVFEEELTLDKTIQYRNDPDTGTEVVNLYTDCANERDNSDAELTNGTLSRADWAGTWPARRTNSEKIKTSDWLTPMKSGDSVTNRPEPEGGYTMPVTGAKNNIMLDELIGLDYDDELWDEFLDQLTLKEMTALMNKGAFHTTAIERLQVPQTTSSDGPVGFVNFIGAPEIYGTCSYPSEVVVSSTWNFNLVKKMGEAVGNEGLIGNEAGDGAPYSGWYAPGLNLHRSPFGGRNYEYYSEDSYLSAKMTAAIVEGCAEKGVYVTMKHIALNDQETNRTGLLTWATEQSMREIFLKAFEIAIKTVNAYADEQGKVIPLAAMSSFNRIGERWTGGDYRLLNTILRDEWGFRGLVISDFNTCTHMNVKDMFYAGGDLNLEMAGWRTYTPDKSSAADVTVMREGAKNILYVVANSNAMRGEFKMVPPTWQILLFVADGVIIAGLAGWGVAVILKAFKKKKSDSVMDEALNMTDN